MSYEGKDLVRAFFFGVRLAEHYHDIPYPLDKEQPDRVVHLLKTIAEGDFTLVDTPEEIENQTDWHPVLRAGELLDVLINLPGSPWQT